MARAAKKILAVDDNPINLSIITEILGDGFQLRLADSGPSAIHIARTFQPRVILLDVMMPDMDGLETCRELRRIPGLARTAIIMVSAKAMPSEQAAGLGAGANDYITKPFDESELVELVRRYTDAHAKKSDLPCNEQDKADEVVAVF